MKALYHVLKALTIGLALFLCYLLQTSIMSWFTLAGVVPNVLLIFAGMLGFMRGRKVGALAGLCSGLLLDLFSANLFGMYALIYMLLGYMNGFFRKIYFGDSLRLPVILVATTDLIYGLMIYCSLFLTRGRIGLSYYFLHVMVPEMVYTVVLSLVFYFPMYHMNQFLDRLEKRRDRGRA